HRQPLDRLEVAGPVWADGDAHGCGPPRRAAPTRVGRECVPGLVGAALRGGPCIYQCTSKKSLLLSSAHMRSWAAAVRSLPDDAMNSTPSFNSFSFGCRASDHR